MTLILLKVNLRTRKSPLVERGLVGQCRIDELAYANSLGRGKGLLWFQNLHKDLPLLKFVAYR